MLSTIFAPFWMAAASTARSDGNSVGAALCADSCRGPIAAAAIAQQASVESCAGKRQLERKTPSSDATTTACGAAARVGAACCACSHVHMLCACIDTSCVGSRAHASTEPILHAVCMPTDKSVHAHVHCVKRQPTTQRLHSPFASHHAELCC